MIVYAIKDKDTGKLMVNCILVQGLAKFGGLGVPILYDNEECAEVDMSMLNNYNLEIAKVKIEEVEE